MECSDVDIDAARQLVRDAIRLDRELFYANLDLETEILGGSPDIGIGFLVRLDEVLQKLATSGPSPCDERISADEIIHNATFSTEEQFNNDAWIDGVISSIQQAYAGVPIDAGGEIIVYEPPIKAGPLKRKKPKK